ncbi:P-loop containing nucleoside triphosphate hydrolase protein [Mycena floridula]|nr:P-loop containing nucleoside triphosphate hydrolase protein [Mycena floridula]
MPPALTCAISLSNDEIRRLSLDIFGVAACLWQILVLRSVLSQQDVLTIAPTGAGKSLTFFLPLLFYETGFSILVTPLKQLGTQFEQNLLAKSINAINMTAETATNAVFTKITDLHYRMVIVSPELLLEDSRFAALWKLKKVTNNLINFIPDEVHVVKDWGTSFRAAYNHLGQLKYILPNNILFLLATATLPPAEVPELLQVLNLRSDSLSTIRLHSDRPNIFIRVQRMQHPANSYRDLFFLIAEFLADPNMTAGAEYLGHHLPAHVRDKIKWFHSEMTDEFRAEEMHALQIGETWGYGSTDAAGMGIDVRDIIIVIPVG